MEQGEKFNEEVREWWVPMPRVWGGFVLCIPARDMHYAVCYAPSVLHGQ